MQVQFGRFVMQLLRSGSKYAFAHLRYLPVLKGHTTRSLEKKPGKPRVFPHV